MKPRILLAIIVLPLGLVLAFVPQNTTKQYKLTPQELLNEVQNYEQFISPEAVAQSIVEKDPTLQLIDVRSQSEYETFHLPGAINIPLESILADSVRYMVDQDIMQNVFYSNGTVTANQAWMITRQLGYNNNVVLQGGLNYWVEAIMNPKAPSSTSPDDEFAKYNYRKAAGGALGGGGAIEEVDNNASSLPKKPIIKRTKKKKVAGGC